jgi:16S rRNA (uracil1498-N3)-methyltransferase
MADRFYTDQPLGAGELTLDGPEAHHMTAVRRFAAGDAVTLFNGDGREYPAVIVEAGKRAVTLRVMDGFDRSRELGFAITIAVAMPKGDRGEFLVEKLTELGVARVVPLVTERSVVNPKDARVEKLRRVVVEACKQCGRNVLMDVDAPETWVELLKREWPAARTVLHTATDAVAWSRPKMGASIVAVGPEGGFTDRELDAARDAGWVTASLGHTILRIETAAIAAATLLRDR